MIFSFLIATFVMSDILFVFFVGSTKISENSDISKCFENFVSQALGVLTRIYAAELREDKIEGVTGDVSDELNRSDNSNDKDNNNFMGIIANK